MPPLAHRCIYRPSRAVDYFRALLQSGLMSTAPAIVPCPCFVFMDSRLCWGCLESTRAKAVVAHKAGSEFLLPPIVLFLSGHPCSCPEAVGRVEGAGVDRTLSEQLGWLGKARLSHFLWGVGRMHQQCGSPT